MTVLFSILMAGLGTVAALAPKGLPWFFAACALALGLFALIRRQRPAPLPLRPSLILLLLFGWMAAATLWSTEPEAAWVKIMQLAVLLPALLLSAGLALRLTRDQARRVALVGAAGLAAGTIGLGIELVADFPLYRLANRIPATETVGLFKMNENLTALAILLPAACGALALVGRGRLGIGLGLLVALLAAPLDSQSAQMALLAGLLVVLLYRAAPRFAGQVVRWGIAAAWLLALPLAQALWALGWQTAPWLHRNFQHRVEIWQFAAERWADKPWFGWGTEASRFIPPGDRRSIFFPDAPSLIPLHPHNAVLQTYLELGLVGAALAATLMLLVLARLGPSAARAWTLAGIAASFAAGLTAFGVFQAWWITILAGLVIWHMVLLRAAGYTEPMPAKPEIAR